MSALIERLKPYAVTVACLLWLASLAAIVAGGAAAWAWISAHLAVSPK